jgi:pyruvate/2-oxoacid:ferredoxin oxidoreductase alpha subunit
VPTQELVDAFLPPYSPRHRLDTAKVESWGNVVTPDMYYRHRRALGESMDQVYAAALEADDEWGELTGRRYGLVERYRCEGARSIIVAMGSMCGTARDAVDAMRDAGLMIGLLKVRLFRPLPVQALRAGLAGVADVLVLDRNYSPGHGGVLHQELRAALYGMADAPRIHGYLAGVGGVNVSPEKIVEFARMANASEPQPDSVWVR